MSDMSTKLKELQAALENNSKDLVQGPNLPIEDIYLKYADLFNNEAGLAAGMKPPTSLMNVFYFAAIVEGEHNIPKAVDKIVGAINDLANKGYLNRFLKTLGVIKLNPVTFSQLSVPQYAVFSYPQLTQEGYTYAESQEYDFAAREGELPRCVIRDEAPQVSKSGRLLHRFKHTINAINAGKPIQDLIYVRTQTLLSFLPEGTELVATHDMPISNLYRDTILEFNHPFFPDGTQVELQYTRIIWPKPYNGGIEQGDITTGIRFLDRDGKEISVEDLQKQILL